MGNLFCKYHDDLSHNQNIEDMKTIPSDRTFGLFASAISIGAGLYTYFTSQEGFVLWWFLLLSGVLLLVVALAAPQFLSSLNRAWSLLGEILGRIVSPMVLLIIFFVLLTPIGLITRFFGRDELRLCKQERGSFWTPREQKEFMSDYFKNQY